MDAWAGQILVSEVVGIVGGSLAGLLPNWAGRFDQALAVLDGVAAGLTDESLRETFLNSDHVQSIRRAAEAPA